MFYMQQSNYSKGINTMTTIEPKELDKIDDCIVNKRIACIVKVNEKISSETSKSMPFLTFNIIETKKYIFLDGILIKIHDN